MEDALAIAGRSLTAAARWWWSELRAAGDPLGRNTRPGEAEVIVQLGREATTITSSLGQANGSPTLRLPVFTEIGRETRDVIAQALGGRPPFVSLDPDAVHVFTLELPRMARARLRKAIDLQLATRSPIDPDLVEATIVSVTPTRPRFADIMVAIARRSAIDAVASRWSELDLPSVAIGVIDPALGTRAIFRPFAGVMGAGIGARSVARMALGAVLIGVIAPAALNRIFDGEWKPMLVEAGALRRGLAPKIKAAAEVPRVRLLGRVLTSAPSGFDALDTLAGLARALPANTWARSVEVGDSQITLALETSDVDAAVQSLRGASVTWRSPRQLGAAPGGGVLVALDRGR